MPYRERYQQDPARYREQSRQWAERNRDRANENAKKWYAEHGRHKLRDWNLAAYGLTRDSYAILLASQDGHCATCSYVPPPGINLSVDHNHNTQRVRGLLCLNCNSALGNAKDSAALLRRLIDYIERTPQAIVVAFARPVKTRDRKTKRAARVA